MHLISVLLLLVPQGTPPHCMDAALLASNPIIAEVRQASHDGCVVCVTTAIIYKLYSPVIYIFKLLRI